MKPFLIFLVLLVSHLAFAEAQQKPMITIPVNPFAPWVIEENGQISGIDIEIIKVLAEELGFRYELVSCPLARCLQLMSSGRADLMLGLFRKPDREGYLAFIEPGYIKDDPKAFYLPVSSELQINTYEDLKPLSLGMVRATSYFPKLDADEELKKIQVNDDEQLIQMLLLGRLDTFVGTPSHIDFLLEEQALTGKIKKAAYRPSVAAYSHIAVAKRSSLINKLDQLTELVNRMVEEGRFEAIVHQSSH